MMRCCLLLMLMPLFAQAQKFTAADLKQLKSYCTGNFSNNAQVTADTHFLRSAIKVQTIWQARKDGAWLFAERIDTGHNYQVWHFYLQDDTTLVMQLFDFKEKQKAVALSSDIKLQSGLFLYHLFTRHDCEVYLKKSKTGYTGASLGKDCFAGTESTAYLSYTTTFGRNGISWQETIFDKEDKEMPAAISGNYIYIKQARSSK